MFLFFAFFTVFFLSCKCNERLNFFAIQKKKQQNKPSKSLFCYAFNRKVLIAPFSLVTSCVLHHDELIFSNVRQIDRGKLLFEYINKRCPISFFGANYINWTQSKRFLKKETNPPRARKEVGVSVWSWHLWHLSCPSIVLIDPIGKLIPSLKGKVVNTLPGPDVP